MSSYRRMTDTLPTCMNCGAVLYGAFCSQCGQQSSERITWRGSMSAAVHSVRTMDSRWLRTAAALTIDPGRMIRRYLRGRRLPYVAPPLYALVAVAICVAVVAWLPVDLSAPGTPWTPPTESVDVETSVASAPHQASGPGEETPSAPADPAAALARVVFALSAVLSLLVAVVTALVQSRLYRSHDLSWTETYAFQLYVFGQLALHQAVFALLGAFASTIGLAALAVVVVLFLAFALSGFYRRSLVGSLPAALLLATVQVAGIFVVGSLVRIALRG